MALYLCVLLAPAGGSFLCKCFARSLNGSVARVLRPLASASEQGTGPHAHVHVAFAYITQVRIHI